MKSLHKKYRQFPKYSSYLPKKFGFKTVKEGEKLAVYSRNGVLKIHDGPTWVFLFRNEFIPLTHYVATPNEHLIVKYNSGDVKYIVGPAEIWNNPLEHNLIEIGENIPINKNEALVVYELNSNDEIQRRIIEGPTTYVPTSTKEWIHEFSWHGATSNSNEYKVPHSLKFEKLRLTPDQMYVKLKDVRTKDDALLDFKFMIFFELEDIEKMLDQTHDPIADMINSLSADVINYTSKFNFMEFKDATSQLNESENYPQTIQRAEKIGYFVKIVLTTWKTNDNIQRMQDSAIESRTKLVLDRETEEGVQNLSDFILEKSSKRSAIEREEKEKETTHQEKMTQMTFENEQKRIKQVKERDIWMENERLKLHLKEKFENFQLEIDHFGKLKEMGVDLTQYLISKEERGNKIIKVDSKYNGKIVLKEE